jgi:lysophospholipase L1-like esterase
MASSRLIEGELSASSKQYSRFITSTSQALPNGLPVLMSSPPTVTLSAAFTNPTNVLAGSSIASARNIPAIKRSTTGAASPKINTETFTFFGQPVNQKGTATSNQQVCVASNASVSGLNNTVYRVEFMIDCVQFEAQLYGAGGGYRIWVDGQPVTQRQQSGPSADANLYNLLVTFSSRATRRITLDLTTTQGFAGINLGPIDSVWPSQVPLGPRLLVFGDSFVDGANGVAGMDTWAFTLGHLLGCRDVQTSGIGGTGFIATAGGAISTQTKINYRPRVQKDLIGHNPDIVVIQASVNDPNSGFANSVLAAEVSAVYKMVRQGLPKSKLIGTGIMRTAGSLTGAQRSHHDTISSIGRTPGVLDLYIDAWPDYHVPPANGSGDMRNWFWGTGNTGAPTGNGNADLYMSNDGTHPSQDGHDYLALRSASAIVNSGVLA